MLKLLGVVSGQVDLILDSSTDVADSPTLQASTWQAWIAAVPDLADWRSITLVGGSFPASLSPSSSYRPHGDVNRREWRAYTRL
ncbi:beta family protein, partial [Escherichia coli]|uniref:beta family protein n=1 Tax=Escherichia coli TaxID=562 RepID=UPI0020100182